MSGVDRDEVRIIVPVLFRIRR